MLIGFIMSIVWAIACFILAGFAGIVIWHFVAKFW
jgi:hypothetical protein